MLHRKYMSDVIPMIRLYMSLSINNSPLFVFLLRERGTRPSSVSRRCRPFFRVRDARRLPPVFFFKRNIPLWRNYLIVNNCFFFFEFLEGDAPLARRPPLACPFWARMPFGVRPRSHFQRPVITIQLVICQFISCLSDGLKPVKTPPRQPVLLCAEFARDPVHG